jgi:tRNA nucleotidyltransferase (CCA-adding enzyme)
VTARDERYPEPAALPIVQPSTIVADLRRRDFTINTLAIRLDGPAAWQLIDDCGGLADLHVGIIRTLHATSFVDDPTRMLRAARFAARLRFVLAVETRQELVVATAAGMIERTSQIRILHELWLILAEPAPEQVLALLDRLNVLQHVVPGLQWSVELDAALAAARTTVTDRTEQRLVQLGILVWALPLDERQRFRARYPWTTAERRLIDSIDTLAAGLKRAEDADMLASELDQIFGALDDTLLHIGALVGDQAARTAIARYEHDLRPVHTLLRGDDLRALGIAPGPRYRILLAGLRAAQLDGLVHSRTDAEQWVQTASTR